MFSRICNLQNTVRNSHYFPDEESEAERGQGTSARWLRQRLDAGLSKSASFSEAVVLHEGEKMHCQPAKLPRAWAFVLFYSSIHVGMHAFISSGDTGSGLAFAGAPVKRSGTVVPL